MEPRDVVRLFLDHGRRDGNWNMDVIEQCFDDRYWSHTWHGDLAHTGARQDRFFSAREPIEELSSDLLAEGDLVVHRTTRRVRHVGEVFGRPPPDRCGRVSPRRSP
jgi:hypothetical protein